MKTAILVLLYAASALAENSVGVCIPIDAFSNCDQAGQAATSASPDVPSETSTGHHNSEPTTGPKVHFTGPDGPKIFDVNSSVDVRWRKDATHCSAQLNCTLEATNDFRIVKGNKPEAISLPQNSSTIESSQFLLPNKSATCIVSMLDAKGNHITETAPFNISDAVDAVDAGQSSTTSGDVPTALTTSHTAISSSLISTNTAKSNATLAASSANSTSTAASSPLTSSVPSTTASPIMSSTVPTTTATKASNSGSNPIARVQAVVGILAGAAALALFRWS